MVLLSYHLFRYEAQIVSKDDRARTVTVHFKGFKDKWDETLSFTAGRMAPIHAKTGYREQIAPIRAVVGEELDVQDTRGVWLEARVIEARGLMEGNDSTTT